MSSIPELPVDVFAITFKLIPLKSLGCCASSCRLFRSLVWSSQHAIVFKPQESHRNRPFFVVESSDVSNALVAPAASLRNRGVFPGHLFPNLQYVSGIVDPDAINPLTSLRSLKISNQLFSTGFGSTTWSQFAEKHASTLEELLLPSYSLTEGLISLKNLTYLEFYEPFAESFSIFTRQNDTSAIIDNLKSVLPHLPQLRTLLIDIDGTALLDAIFQLPSIRHFSAKFKLLGSKDPESITEALMSDIFATAPPHLCVYQDGRTFWQLLVSRRSDFDMNKTPLPAALTQKITRFSGFASFDPAIPNVRSNVSTIDDAIINQDLPVIRYIRRNYKLPSNSTHFLHVTEPLQGPKFVLHNPQCDQTALCVQYFAESLLPEALQEFDPQEISATALCVAIMRCPDATKLQVLLALQKPLRLCDYVTVKDSSSSEYLIMTPLQLAFYHSILSANPTNYASSSHMALFNELLLHVKTLEGFSVVDQLNEAVFTGGRTALHLAVSPQVCSVASCRVSFTSTLLSLGCNPWFKSFDGVSAAETYLLNGDHPWNPELGLSAEKFLDSRDERGDFAFVSVLRYLREGIEPFLKEIQELAVRRGTHASLLEDLIGSSHVHPAIAQYFLIQDWSLSLEELSAMSIEKMAQHTKLAPPLLVQAALSFTKPSLRYAFNLSNPSLRLLLNCHLPEIRNNEFSASLLKNLRLNHCDAVEMSIFARNGLYLDLSQIETIALAKDLLPRSFGAVAFLVQHFPALQRLDIVAQILRDTSLDQKILVEAIRFMYNTWKELCGQAQSASSSVGKSILHVLISQLVPSTLLGSSSKMTVEFQESARDFWDKLRKDTNLTPLLENLISNDETQLSGLIFEALMVCVSADCSSSTLARVLRWSGDKPFASPKLDKIYTEMLLGISTGPFSGLLLKNCLLEMQSLGFKISVQFPPELPISPRHEVLSTLMNILIKQIEDSLSFYEALRTLSFAIIRWWYETEAIPVQWRQNLWRQLCSVPDADDSDKFLLENHKFLQQILDGATTEGQMQILRRMFHCGFFRDATLNVSETIKHEYASSTSTHGITELRHVAEPIPVVKEQLVNAFAFSSSSAAASTNAAPSLNTTTLFRPSAFGNSFAMPTASLGSFGSIGTSSSFARNPFDPTAK